ncbi:flavin reductase (DIM6/NTAB) family NADH-FMN oxidoreductase RutF [Roseospira visakhapatnamensis]|uniref:Flavin reductase (DIM6/NTAB) family NADH-FMN oxidoreductase RutF n=1 Tax=Roseospira visakhapatnamensis TaxID=390880 RepID=A0A7W6RFL9_9PROT|nr:flavin reductase (DIM6/NTAB) family NADH-FMN oxidoreductase RutF [Roseospira visakhapatnamensis]
MTARDATGTPVGLTVSAFASLSLDPPLILICLNRDVHDLAVFHAGPFAVNILSEGQQALSRRFAGPREARFLELEVEAARNGCPILPESLAVIECRMESVVAGGDHDIIIGAVTSLRCHPEGRPLIYYAGGYNRLADAPPTAR